MDQAQSKQDRVIPTLVLIILASLGLLALGQYDYLLFHGLAEFFSIAVALTCFSLAWSARRSLQNGYFLFIGVSFLFVGLIDMLHALAYKDMGFFPGGGANLPTQLWIIGRGIQALSLFLGAIFVGRKLHPDRIFIAFLLGTGVVLAVLFLGYFPAAYIDGVGLTPFKVVGEYFISGLMIATIWLLYRRRAEFDPRILRDLVTATMVAILSELAFSVYMDVFGLMNQLGHMLKIISFYFIYRAIVESSFRTPYAMLVKELKQSETELRDAYAQVEQRVNERTRELFLSNQSLNQEIQRRMETEQALVESETRFRSLFAESPIGLMVRNPAGQVVMVNKALEKMLGYSVEEWENLDLCSLMEAEPREVCKREFQTILTGKSERFEMENCLPHKDGDLRWAYLTTIPLRDNSGTVRVTLTTIEDIHARKSMQLEFQEIQRRLLDSKEEERLHLARELHDGPIQELLALAMRMSGFRRDLPENAQAEMADIERCLQEINQTLRDFSGDLRPPALAPFGLERAIHSHADRFCRDHPNIRVDLALEPDGQNLPPTVRQAFYRIYQQALINVVRHAQADTVWVNFYTSRNETVLEIRDNGIGFFVPPRWIELVRGGHLGIVGMSERAEAVGGKLSVESQPGDGTIIRAVVPLREKPSPEEPQPMSSPLIP